MHRDDERIGRELPERIGNRLARIFVAHIAARAPA